MHNVKRVKQSREAIEAQKLKEKSKITAYLALSDEILTRKKSGDYSKEAFDLTTRILQLNPEFYTVWNYRRNILTNGIFKASSSQEINDMLSDDLAMTTTALKVHPKVYWIWTHRIWCLDNVPDGPGSADDDGDRDGWRKSYWDKEMLVVEKMLEADPRNFHAWRYRRYVLANMPIPRSETSELTYTKRKIESNFSNFSAWHQRSKVLSSLWAQGALDPVESKEKEFELVRDAMYTDPNDQSVWIYHRWLVGAGDNPEILHREIQIINELLDEQSDSKWCMESIVHYNRLLLRQHATAESSEQLINESVRLLDSLCELDPGRSRRYDEISESIPSLSFDF
ncbi:rab-protein geranylgeranyltransferase [Mycena floridula]|nr:rab-protein geranylgeranyltransferase [Mycena floridula]